MSAPKDGGPAFPVPDMGVHGNFGMTLRDYFAAQAMQAIMSLGSKYQYQGESGVTVKVVISRDAYDLADAMLAQRAKAEGRS